MAFNRKNFSSIHIFVKFGQNRDGYLKFPDIRLDQKAFKFEHFFLNTSTNTKSFSLCHAEVIEKFQKTALTFSNANHFESVILFCIKQNALQFEQISIELKQLKFVEQVTD